MRYWLLAGVSAFSAFAMFALAGAIASRLIGAAIARRLEQAPAATRARVFFRLRILSGTAALVAAFGVALPIFLWFEDRATVEPVSRTLAIAGGAGVLLLLAGLWRAAASWVATRRFVRACQRRGRRVDGLATRLPAFAVDEPFPTVAVAGIVRPRLFIAERVLREFTAGEIDAMIAHECAHVSARDNVKRLLMRACPDVFGAPRALEGAWRAASEEAADASAATLRPSARIDLAQALIRVARLAAPRPPALVSAFYVGGSIDARVRRLVDPAPATVSPRWLRVMFPVAGMVFAAAIVLAAPSLHSLMEQAVRMLP